MKTRKDGNRRGRAGKKVVVVPDAARSVRTCFILAAESV